MRHVTGADLLPAARRSADRGNACPGAMEAGCSSIAPKGQFVEALQRDLACPVPPEKIFLFPLPPNQG